MSASLRLTESSPRARPRFERFAWERWLIDCGAMSKLKPAERAVLWMMAIAADRQGESYWSLPRLAAATGYQDKAGECRAVRNARQSLASAGLIELVEQGGGKRASRYRIIMQQVQGPQACRDTSEPDARSKTRSTDNGDDPGTYVPDEGDPGTYVPPTPEPTFPPPRNVGSGVTAHLTNQRTAAAARAPQGDDSVALWDSPPATARAAAAALIDFGFSAREAAGIVSQHRPTAEQVRVVVANANAWIAAAERGERAPMKLPRRFVLSQIKGRHFDPDPAVLVEQRKAQAEHRRADREQAERSQAQQRDRERERLARAETAYDALPEPERRRMHDELNAGLARPASPARLRQWSIEALAAKTS